MKRSSRQPNLQEARSHVLKTAHEHGVFAIRRRLSSESVELIGDLIKELDKEVKHTARIFIAGSLGVTIIGFSRFDKKHRQMGPKTVDVINEIGSARNPIIAALGNLSIVGSGRKHKLALGLTSQELLDEAQAFEEAFCDLGFPLRQDPNTANGLYSPHLSVALLDEDYVRYYNDKRERARLGNAVLSAVSTRTITLAPPSPGQSHRSLNN